MKANEFKFKVTNKDGVSAIISLDDIYGYEGFETQGVLIKYNPNIPKELQGEEINFNSGYGNHGINDELDFKYIKGGNNED